MAALNDDHAIRLTAFKWLKEQVDIHGNILARELLADGFEYQGHRIPLVSPVGIFKPALLKLPLTITTAPNGPYSDTFSADGTLLYKYRGANPNHRDNVGLRELMRRQIPLIYFHGLAPGKYEPVWPVYIIGDDPAGFTFKVTADAFESVIYDNEQGSLFASDIDAEIRRRYITTEVRQRLHQHTFREKVLAAYRNQCSFCRLKHPELLDAAHIIPDREDEGEPVVNNGLSLCKIHHAAFDNLIVGIRPDDFVIEVREDIRREEDGPMLLHGLQELHDSIIILPNSAQNWPDRNKLAVKFERFKAAR